MKVGLTFKVYTLAVLSILAATASADSYQNLLEKCCLSKGLDSSCRDSAGEYDNGAWLECARSARDAFSGDVKNVIEDCAAGADMRRKIGIPEEEIYKKCVDCCDAANGEEDRLACVALACSASSELFRKVNGLGPT